MLTSGLERMSLWSDEGLLSVDLGLVSLGDVVVPVFPAGTAPLSTARVHSTTYRAEQSQGWVRWVATRPGGFDKGVVVAEKHLAFPKGRAGEFRVELVCALASRQSLGISAEQQGRTDGSVKDFDLALPESLSECRRAGLSPEAFEEIQRAVVHAELFLRWLRTLLREPASRRAVRGRFQDFVSLCDRVERSVEAEDLNALQDSLTVVSGAATELSEALGVVLFPVSPETLFLPES